MGGVDRGDQHRLMGVGFANVSQFKKWYKKAFMGPCNFSLSNAFTAWNLAINCDTRRGRGDCSTMKRLLKWEFYSVAAEEMTTYFDDNENIDLVQRSVGRAQMYTTSPVTKDDKLKNPTCMICSVEESIKKICVLKTRMVGDLREGKSIFRIVMIHTVI